jgi:glycosyltransferase involved in cell wall biosynthesis
MIEQNNLSVVYLAPGWPLKLFPNGIVAYIENIISGFDRNTQAYILANQISGNEMSDHIVDLSSVVIERTFIEAFLDKVASRTALSFAQRYIEERLLSTAVQKVEVGLKLLDLKPDIIEVEESFGLTSPLVRQLSIPVVTRLHGPWFILGSLVKDERTSLKARVKAEGLAISASQGITSPSEDVLNRVREFYGCRLPDARVIPNPIKQTPKHLCWHIESSMPPYVLFVGRFDLIKGADIAINAFRLVALKSKDIELVFVGPDRGLILDSEHYSLDKYLKKFIPELDIRHRVKILGHCTSEKISSLRKKASVTVVTSRYENFPMSLLESLSAGCPTVAVAVGGIKEIIIDGYNGLLADPESAGSIAEKVESLLDSSEKSKKISQNAILDSEQRFSPTAVAKQTTAYYRSIIAG